MTIPRVLVLRMAGANCDLETAHAFRLAGAEVERVHIRAFLGGKRKLGEFGALAIPGGFSYGDDLGAGTVLANQLRTQLAGDLSEFVRAGKLVIGICNGFQVLVRLGILPRLDEAGGKIASLIENESGRFEARWVRLRVETDRSPFLRKGTVLELPIAHKEGRFVVKGPRDIEDMERSGQIALRYLEPEGNEVASGFPANPNGSTSAIAGVINREGNVLGLMPHPERHLSALQHPSWTRKAAIEGLPAAPERAGDGYAVFENAVRHLRGA